MNCYAFPNLDGHNRTLTSLTGDRDQMGWSDAYAEAPFGVLEVEAMSRTLSPSSNKPYGVARLAAVWTVGRHTQKSPASFGKGPGFGC